MNGITHFYNKFFNNLARFRKSRSGTILIEFAFSIPVFLALIYYLHDLPKMKRWNRKMQFAANEAAMMLQNFAAQRTKEGKKISKNDLKAAARMAGLSTFPGVSQYSLYGWSNMPLGYMQLTQVYYVVGEADGRAKVKWFCRIFPFAGDPDNYRVYDREGDSFRLVNVNATTPSAICPGLKISKGEAKIIIEICIHTHCCIISSSGKGDANPAKVLSFLFYILSTTTQNYFRHVAIFTPQGNAFTETIPQ